MVDPFDLMMFNKQDTISVEKRVEYYKKWFEDCKAVKLLKGFEFPVDRIEALEAIRALNTELADLYMVSIPVITCWVRDDNYVSATGTKVTVYLEYKDLEQYKEAFLRFVKPFSDTDIEKCWEQILADDARVIEFDGFSTETSKFNGDIEYMSIYGSIE